MRTSAGNDTRAIDEVVNFVKNHAEMSAGIVKITVVHTGGISVLLPSTSS